MSEKEFLMCIVFSYTLNAESTCLYITLYQKNIITTTPNENEEILEFERIEEGNKIFLYF